MTRSSAVGKPAARWKQVGESVTPGQRRTVEIALTISAPVVVLVLWEGFSRSGWINPIFWPAPSSLVDTFWQLWRDDDLLADIRASLVRVIGGFLIGALPGALLGLAMGLFWPVRVFLMPIATAIYAIPKIAVLPLFLIAFGIGDASKIATAAISIFFLVALNAMGGVLAIDDTFRDVARDFGASRWAMFWTVALPGALPSVFTGLRLALGFSLLVIIGTEFVQPPDAGLGALIWDSWSVLAIEKMYVGVIVVGLLGWILTVGLETLERIVIPWRPVR